MCIYIYIFIYIYTLTHTHTGRRHDRFEGAAVAYEQTVLPTARPCCRDILNYAHPIREQPHVSPSVARYTSHFEHVT